MLAWRSHIDGAVRIVQTRGREEMCRTRLGTLLFTAVRHHVVRLSSSLEIFGGEGVIIMRHVLANTSRSPASCPLVYNCPSAQSGGCRAAIPTPSLQAVSALPWGTAT
jgi:hypothetical protein